MALGTLRGAGYCDTILGVRLVTLAGSATDLHARVIPADLAGAEVWLFEPSGPALVLGSAQREWSADAAATAAAGVEVVRRRSGGGAVYVAPQRCLWLDVVVPRGDPRWSDDVREATYWLGAAWVEALGRVGLEASLHRGGLDQAPWSRSVCFAGLGPGEVLIDSRKAVGVSQRRTRAGARFQCVVYDRWNPYDVLDLLDLSDADRRRSGADLAEVATGVGGRLDDLRDAVIEVLVGE